LPEGEPVRLDRTGGGRCEYISDGWECHDGTSDGCGRSGEDLRDGDDRTPRWVVGLRTVKGGLDIRQSAHGIEESERYVPC
jgi:hypothetical protein